MRRTTILNAAEVKKTSYKEAQSSYFKHCRLRNLRPQTIAYYKEDTDYFQAKTGVKYISDAKNPIQSCGKDPSDCSKQLFMFSFA